MSKKIKVLQTVQTTENAKDIEGFGISKGTILHVTAEGPKAPFGDGHKVLVVRVDNGTGHLDLMPETAIRNTEVPFKVIKKI